MQKKLYIGNLSFNAKEDDLQKLFSEYGKVEDVSIIADRQTGRPKGFAFIHMASEDEAQRALDLNGHEFMGRKIQVTEARSEGPYGAGGRHGESRRPDRNASGLEQGRPSYRMSG